MQTLGRQADEVDASGPFAGGEIAVSRTAQNRQQESGERCRRKPGCSDEYASQID